MTSISQDNYGFLWIATQDGLNRFDGTNFKKHEAYFLDETMEKFSRLGKVYIDRVGKIWALTSDGYIKLLQEESDQLESIMQLDHVSSLLQISEGKYLTGSFSKGLYTLDYGSTIDTTAIIKDIGIYNIIEAEGYFLCATSSGVMRYDSSDNSIKYILPELTDVHVSDIALLNDKSYIFSTFSDGLFIGSLDSVLPYPDLPRKLRVQDIHQSKDGHIWIATYSDGLYRIGKNLIQNYKAQSSSQSSINYNDVLCIFEDQNENIWIGTDGGGLSVYNSDQKPIYSVTNDAMPLGMPVDVPRAISIERDGKIWVGTSGKGLTLVDLEGENHRHYHTQDLGNYRIGGDRIMSLIHDQNNNLWIGTQENGLLFKPASSKIIDSVKKMSQHTIWDINIIDDNRILLCTRNSGVILYNYKTSEQTIIKAERLHSYRVAIKAADQNKYFIGTDDGDLLMLDLQNEILEYVDPSKNFGAIKSLFLDNNILWIGTLNSGLYIYNLENNSVSQLDQSKGLPNNVIYAIMEEDAESVWISTNAGISEIAKDAVYNDSSDVVLQHLTINNGLICNEFNTGAYSQDEKGNVYFGGINGVIWFKPNSIRKDLQPVEILLLELITTENKLKINKEIHDLDHIRIPFRKRHFQIRYSDLSFDNANSIKYRYRLKGYDDVWTDNEEYKLANFSNVPPGDYTFQIIASNKDGIWNKKPKEIQLSITPAVWQTLWFKLVAAGFFLISTYLIIHTRISYIKRTALLNQQIVRSEAKALKSQMNPHFLFNSLTAIDNYILNNSPKEASEYLSKFSKLIRQTLDYSDQQNITLQQEITILELYIHMEQMRFPSKFDYHISVNPDIDKDDILLPPLVIQPYVENAIWHGLMHLEDDGELLISFDKQDDLLLCTIQDNGIGRDQAKENKSKSAIQRKSHGMKITSERLRLLDKLKGRGGEVEVIDLYSELRQSKGTKVMIKLPLIS